MNMSASASKNIVVQIANPPAYSFVYEETVNTDDGTCELVFKPTAETVNLTIAFGATSAAEAGTYDNITLSGITLTETDETTTEEVAVEDEDGYMSVIYDTWTTVGNWKLYSGAGTSASISYKGAGTDFSDMAIKIATGVNGGSEWGIQAGVNVDGLVSGKQYDYTMVINSNKAGALFTQVPGIAQSDNIAITEGDNTISGTFTAGANPANGNIVIFPNGMPDGTILDMVSLEVTDHVEGETTTKVPGSTEWKSLGEGYSYDTENTVKEVVSIQQPPWAAEKGIYMNVPAGISAVSVNGVTENVATIQGAGVLVFLSALTKNINEVVITYAGGTGTLTIKNDNVPAETESSTDPVVDPTEEPTDPVVDPTDEPTDPVVDPTEEPSTESAWDENAELSIGNVEWKDVNGKKTFNVEFTPVSAEITGDADPYFYCIYLDEINSDHSAMNLSSGWNWKNNAEWLNPAGGFNNAYKFDEVFSTAADYAVNGADSAYLEDGADHKVIIVAYKTVAEAQADVNPVAIAEADLDIPTEIVTTTRGEAEVVADINITSAVIDRNGITVDWEHPAGMESYAQEFYLGTADEVIEDEAHWARNGTADWVWGNTSGRTQIDVVVSTKDKSLNVENGGDFVVRIVYLDANGVVVARGTTEPITFEAYVNTDMAAFQERNEDLTAYLKWTKVTGAASYKVFDEEENIVADNVVNDWAAVELAEYDTVYTYTIKAYDADGNEIEVTNNVVDALVATPSTTLPAPAGLVGNGTLFTWQAVDGAVSYNIYIDGEFVASTVETSYDIADDLIDAPADIYFIDVVAVDADGEEGEPAEAEYEIEEEAPEALEMTELTADDVAWFENGEWSYYLGAWSGTTAQMGIDPEDPDHIQVQKSACANWDPWGLQIKKTVTGLTPGATYYYIVDMYASSSDGSYVTSSNGTATQLEEGYQYVEIEDTADENGTVEFTIGLGSVGVSVLLDFSYPEVYDEEYELVYPSDDPVVDPTDPTDPTEPTTPGVDPTEPTTPGVDPTEPTTPGVDPTEPTTPGVDPTEPTTPSVDPTDATTPSVVPTTADQKETVAPTTKATVKPAKPDKVKIKKVNKKKKSSKKVKLTLKKIAGVEGYQVAVYKTKKNAKKNKKALVKKYVKKVKVTIKSKKLKNKKKLYVRARAYVMDGKTRLYGKWSKVKRVKIKK